MGPACSYKERELFTNPVGRDAPSTQLAVRMCERCPIRRQCAEQALEGGATIDRSLVAPAVGVIQAGVYCDGSERARWELAAVAGHLPPIEESPTRFRPGDRCKACGTPMVKWHRGVTPEGYVMHRGRGYCTQCRSAYNAELARAKAAGDVRTGLRKPIDRKRHTAPPRTTREVVVQFSLFEMEAM